MALASKADVLGAYRRLLAVDSVEAPRAYSNGTLLRPNMRVDLVVFNHEVHVVETAMESRRVRAVRLRVRSLSAFADRVTVVVSPTTSERVIASVPSWWAVAVARNSDGVTELKVVRPGAENPSRCAEIASRMLPVRWSVARQSHLAPSESALSKRARGLSENGNRVGQFRLAQENLESVLRRRKLARSGELSAKCGA